MNPILQMLPDNSEVQIYGLPCWKQYGMLCNLWQMFEKKIGRGKRGRERAYNGLVLKFSCESALPVAVEMNRNCPWALITCWIGKRREKKDREGDRRKMFSSNWASIAHRANLLLSTYSSICLVFPLAVPAKRAPRGGIALAHVSPQNDCFSNCRPRYKSSRDDRRRKARDGQRDEGKREGRRCISTHWHLSE